MRPTPLIEVFKNTKLSERRRRERPRRTSPRYGSTRGRTREPARSRARRNDDERRANHLPLRSPRCSVPSRPEKWFAQAQPQPNARGMPRVERLRACECADSRGISRSPPTRTRADWRNWRHSRRVPRHPDHGASAERATRTGQSQQGDPSHQRSSRDPEQSGGAALVAGARDQRVGDAVTFGARRRCWFVGGNAVEGRFAPTMIVRREDR